MLLQLETMRPGDGALALLDLGFGAVSSWNGRGTVPEDHPMTIGGLNGNGASAVQAFYDQCDLMLVVGSRVRAQWLDLLCGDVVVA